MSARHIAQGLALAATEARRRAEEQRAGAIKYAHDHDVITLLVVADTLDNLALWCDEQAAAKDHTGEPVEPVKLLNFRR